MIDRVNLWFAWQAKRPAVAKPPPPCAKSRSAGARCFSAIVKRAGNTKKSMPSFKVDHSHASIHLAMHIVIDTSAHSLRRTSPDAK